MSQLFRFKATQKAITNKFVLPFVSSYQVKTHKIEKAYKKCQMFARTWIPRKMQAARKHGVFTNVAALAFRINAIYTHVSEFCTRQSVFLKTFILNHPVDIKLDGYLTA